MKFIIRDDDLHHFSTPADIQAWYQDIFNQKIPVGFSVIPFVKATSDVYMPDVTGVYEEFPIHTNVSLCSYVEKESHIHILQHGTTHETINGLFEYAREVPVEETLRGKKELEKAFNRTVSIFVPPHDWIGSSGIRSVEYAQMNIIRGRGAGLRNVIFRTEYIINFIHMLVYKGWHMVWGKVPAYPHVLNFGKHKELCSYRLEDTDVFEGLAYANKKNGIFVVVTHLHYYTPEKKERLLAIIKEAKELGAEFVSPYSVL